MVQRFETDQWVPFPVELVFAFFANPSNLPHLTPPDQKARIEDLRLQPPPPRPLVADPARRFRSIAAGEGSEILISFRPVRWIPQRVSWLARIVEFEWNSHFVDEQVRGPFKEFRHRHAVRAEIRDGVEGTRFPTSFSTSCLAALLAGSRKNSFGRKWKRDLRFGRNGFPRSSQLWLGRQCRDSDQLSVVRKVFRLRNRHCFSRVGIIPDSHLPHGAERNRTISCITRALWSD